MSDRYVESKIHEALKATNGDKKDAVKLIITWAVRDQPLLLGLVKSSLKDIAAAQIEDVVRGKKKTADKEDSAAIVLGHPKDKRHPAKVPPPKSSERQASVMHQLVAAFKKKN